ncbi:MAG: hypothetical protein LBN21_09920 [Treponema sp.]|jgi:hypothetical protein|nr:hypothetical protein [Treponema sp.]
MRKNLPALIFFLSLLPFFLDAQESKPVIKMNPLFAQGIGLEESRFIESLVQSYLSDIGEVINYFDAALPGISSDGGSVPDSWTRIPDYTISGSIHLERDSRIFLLEIFNVKTGDTYSVTSVYKSTGELALKTRSVLESAFAVGGFFQEDTGQKAAEPITENSVVGTWRGEPGVEMIRLQRGGRGVAVFSSGAQMVLSYVIEDKTLYIWQISPNSERFYYPLPYNTAKQLAGGAEPIAWEMSLYQQGAVLEGIKIATAARMDGDRVAELIPGGDIQEVKWARSPR